jgi:hypothetical protein
MAILARRGSEDVLYLVGSGWDVPTIDTFLRNVFIYRDEDHEVLRDVPFMLNDWKTQGRMEGDCDDMAIMGCALLRASGIPARMTAIKSQNPDEFDHVFSEARVGPFWIPIDPTVPPGTEYMQYGFMSEPI